MRKLNWHFSDPKIPLKQFFPVFCQMFTLHCNCYIFGDFYLLCKTNEWSTSFIQMGRGDIERKERKKRTLENERGERKKEQNRKRREKMKKSKIKIGRV